MKLDIRAADAADIPLLVELMREFYAEAEYALPAEPAANAFAALLSDERLGRVWIAITEGGAAGYIGFTTTFAVLSAPIPNPARLRASAALVAT